MAKTEGLLWSAQPDVIMDSDLHSGPLLTQPAIGSETRDRLEPLIGSLKKALSGGISS